MINGHKIKLDALRADLNTGYLCSSLFCSALHLVSVIERNPSAATFAGARPGEAGSLAMRSDRRRFPGRPDKVACVRDFVRLVLGPVPVLEEAVLLASELSTNAVLHTASGNSGTFEVAVYASTRHARIEVHDQGSEWVPEAVSPDGLAEAGRGVSLVELIASRWGQSGDATGRSVFFELCW